MKNVGQNNSNRKRQSASAQRQDNRHGRGVRAAGRGLSDDSTGISGGTLSAVADAGLAAESERSNLRAAQPDAERPADSGGGAGDGGGSSGGDGGGKRQRRAERDTRDGNDGNDRAKTGDGAEVDSQPDLRQIAQPKPLKVRKTRKKKVVVSEESSKLTVVTLLTAASSAIFTSVSLLTKHDHWSLDKPEATALAEALNDALTTLPEKSYAFVLKILEQWVPWINLIFVVSAIIFPRIEESAKRAEEARYKPREGGDGGDAGAKANSNYRGSSLGWNQ